MAAGGGMLFPGNGVPSMVGYGLGLTGRPEPRLCLLNTAMGDEPQYFLRMYSRLAGTPARVSHLALFPMPNVTDPEDLLLSQDMIFVGGGSVANMVAVWRVHGLDHIMRKAWQAGIVLAGSSAGGICWFEGGHGLVRARTPALHRRPRAAARELPRGPRQRRQRHGGTTRRALPRGVTSAFRRTVSDLRRMTRARRPAYADRVQALYAWLRRHPRLVDGALALVLAAAGTTSWLVSGKAPYALPLEAVMLAAVTLRRAYPVGAFAVSVGAGALQVLAGIRPSAVDLSVVVLLYTLTAYRSRQASLRGLAVCLAGSAIAIARWIPEIKILQQLDVVFFAAVLFAGPALIAWALGDSMRSRRAYYTSLEERAARLERERDAQAQIAAAAERARIARDMHDVIAHNVSVMVVQADGAAFALDAEPERARQALGAISQAGRQALAEMRHMLDVLRTGDDAAELTPQPGVGQIGDLIGQARDAELAVSFTAEGVPRPLPGGADLAAYRIVQESLTNVRKHGGPGVSASVTLRYCEDCLVLRITDDGRGAAAASGGAGHGLAGMRERVGIYGGTVRAGPRPGGGFEVTATLPFTAPAADDARPPAPERATGERAREPQRLPGVTETRLPGLARRGAG